MNTISVTVTIYLSSTWELLSKQTVPLTSMCCKGKCVMWFAGFSHLSSVTRHREWQVNAINDLIG